MKNVYKFAEKMVSALVGAKRKTWDKKKYQQWKRQIQGKLKKPGEI